ncbi:MAG: ABC transporter ATP-binding protein [Candidatus Omnitrophica bacterium]|nr:ABC transporter ATP-binding protein [Candidatus Omnitrophota bacterium]
MNKEVLLRSEGIFGGYTDEIVVKDVSFSLNAGEFLGIIGPNGSGKSTLLRLLTRVLTPKKGSIYLAGKDAGKIPLKEFFRRVAFVPQDMVVNFSFTVWEIALMGRIPHLGRLQLETRKDFAATEEALLLTDTFRLKEKYIDNISAGERQRVVIAKALAQEPVLLFLDEPTSHLDIAYQIQVLELLKKLNKENGLTIVMVLHDLNLASEYCNRIMLLDKGSVFKDGSPSDVLTYGNIEAVYKTAVLVNKNPLSLKPFITVVSGESRCIRN